MKARSFRHERAHALAEVSRLQSEADADAQRLADGVSAAGTAGAPVAIMNATNDPLCRSGAKVVTQPSYRDHTWAAPSGVPERWPAHFIRRT